MPQDDVLDWLLASDEPSIRYRLLRELQGRPEDDPEVVAAANAISRKGWAASLLELQLPAGQWVTPGTSMTELYRPKYAVTNWSLIILAELGATRADPRVAKGAEMFLARASDPADDGLGGSGSELCFTANAARLLTLFGYGSDPRVGRAVDWLVGAQKTDGGWHCFPSDTGTLDAWEALAAFAAIPPHRRSAAVRSSIDQGLEFFLDRKLMQEGPERYEPWFRLHYPNHYYYDVLVGLDIVTALGRAHDPRTRPALDWLEAKRDRSGRWHLDRLHPDVEGEEFFAGHDTGPLYSLGLEEPGRPSRWITLRALTVLRRAGRA